MADVFISYKREERDKAKGLAEAIVKRGYSVWWDVDLLPGDRFAREIDAVIGKAKAAIVLWSAASINSDWVIAEATEAKKRQILIPARLDGAEPPLYFRGDHSIDLSEWDGAAVSPAIEPILAAIERRVGAPSARPSVAASVVADALAAPNLEAEFWRTVSGAPVQTIREYEAYLQKFGASGLFSDVALMRIEALKARAPVERVDKSLGLVRGVVGVIAALFAIVGVVHQLSKTGDGAGDKPRRKVAATSMTLDRFTPERFNSEDADKLGDEALESHALEDLEALAPDDPVAATLAGFVHGFALGGTAVDASKATRLYRQGCDGGIGRACFFLAIHYGNGTGVTPDLAAASQIFARGCDLGNAASCTELGYNYESARGVAQSDIKAADYYRRGCEGRSALGCNNLGNRFQNGKGVTKSDSEAVKYYRQSCDAGSAAGCGNLGFVMANGIGISPNSADAVKYYRKACDGGDAVSCSNLGYMLQYGNGAPQSDVEAADFYRKACDGGSAMGCANYGHMLDHAKGVANDPAAALRNYAVGCEGGVMFACTSLGFMYSEARGVPQNDVEAIASYRKACDGADSAGCNSLGAMYFNGRGIEADVTRGAALFERALELDPDNESAKSNLALARKGA